MLSKWKNSFKMITGGKIWSQVGSTDFLILCILSKMRENFGVLSTLVFRLVV